MENLPFVPTVMVSHDAGGAEILSAIAARLSTPPRCLLGGPAEGIFRRKLGLRSDLTFDDLLKLDRTRDFILTGTSRVAALERETIRIARQQKIPCASFLDHWLNYEMRFGAPSDWNSQLPDYIWVGDPDALVSAQRAGFPEERTVLVPNPHFDDVRKWLSGHRHDAKAPHHKTILFVSEPFSHISEPKLDFDEYQVLQGVLAAIARSQSKEYAVIVRPHPSQGADEFRRILETDRSGVTVKMTDRESVLEDLARASLVIGMESMALVLAALAEIPVLSVIPSKTYCCHLPQKAVVKIRSLDELGSFL